MHENLYIGLGFVNRVARKGVPCHVEVLKAYASGLGLTQSDSFVFIDVLPNRLVLDDG